MTQKKQRPNGSWIIIVAFFFATAISTLIRQADPSPGAWLDYGRAIQLLAFGLAVVWGLSSRIQRTTRVRSFFCALATMAVVGVCGSLLFEGLGLGRLVPIMIPYMVGASISLLGLVVAFRACRRKLTPTRFMVLLYVSLVAVSSVALSAFLGMSFILPGGLIGGLDWFVFFVVVGGPLAGLAIGSLLYIILFPYMLLSLRVPYYRVQFDHTFRPSTCFHQESG